VRASCLLSSCTQKRDNSPDQRRSKRGELGLLSPWELSSHFMLCRSGQKLTVGQKFVVPVCRFRQAWSGDVVTGASRGRRLRAVVLSNGRWDT